MTREVLIEVMAAVILDAHHLWLEDDTDFSGFETRFASAALAGLEAAGVRLVPELLAMVEENARLREALAILDAADEFEGEPDDKKLFVAMRVADLRRARAALKETGQ